MSVFGNNQKSHMNRKIFLDGDVGMQRYDQVKYPQFDLLTEQQLGFFWRPQEIDLSKDSKDFKDLTEHEKHIFTSNLKRQIILDSVQGRAPISCFGPVTSLPEIESWNTAWTFSEMIHSKSYTHIIRNIYANPSEIFDSIMDIKEIVDCAKDISKYYDELGVYNTLKSIYDNRSFLEKIKNFVFPSTRTAYTLYEHKKAIWMALNAVNALEGVRFYVSFGCSWAFAELGKMVGNADIIKQICKDENLHLSATQKLLDILPKEDEDFIKIKEECVEEVIEMFKSVVDQEKAWADYLFKDGSMIGLNANILKEYVEFIAGRRMKAIGLDSPYDVKSNPLPWTLDWISGRRVQVAPQEQEITDYIIGGIKQDITEDTFAGFSLE